MEPLRWQITGPDALLFDCRGLQVAGVFGAESGLIQGVVLLGGYLGEDRGG